MATAELTVSANLSGLRQQLESIPGMTAEQARLMTAELNKSIKASERAAKAAADASKRAMESAGESAREAASDIGNVGDKFGNVGSSASKLAGGLGMLGPEFASAAQNVADLADVGEVGAEVFGGFGAALGPVVAVVALFAAGLAPIGELLADTARRAEEAKVAIDAFAEAQEAAGNASATVTDQLRAISEEIRIKTGLETVDEQALRRKTDALYASVDALEESYAAESEAAQQTLESTRIEYGLLGAKILTNKATAEEAARYAELGESVNAATATLTKNAASLERTRAAADASAEALKDIAEAEKAAKQRAEALTKAKEAQARAAKAAAEAAAIEAQKRRELEAVISKAQAITDSEISQAGRILKQQRELRAELEKNPAAFGAVTAAIGVLDRQLEALDKQEIDAYLKRQADAAKDLQTAFEALIPPEVPTRQEQFATLTDQVTEAMRNGTITFDDYQKKLKQIQEAQEETFSLETLNAFFENVQSKSSQLFSDLSAVSDYFMAQSENAVEQALAARKSLGEDATAEEKKQATERVKAAKDEARKQFELNKALQMAQIIVNTATSATQAALVAPPPANLPFIAAALAAGAVQLATVQATTPKFHKGGLIGQPDEGMAVVRSGEAVLNPMGRSLLGDDTIRAANAGMGGGSSHAVQVVYKHKSFDYFVRDHLRTNATLPRALNAGRRLGQRGG